MSESVKAALSERTSRGRSHLAAGFTGGAFSSAALQPFDVLKTRIQQGQHASLLKTFHSTVGTGEQRSLIRLWRGTLPSIVRSSLGSGMYFYALNEMRQFFSIRGLYPSKSGRPEKGKLPMLSGQANLLTGATARATVGFVMMPITIIKVRYESSLYAYQSIVHAVKDIYKNHGPRGFFYGSGATAIRDAPYAGLYVYVYEACKSRLNEMVEPKSHGLTTVYINFSSGSDLSRFQFSLT